jgi:MFS family permease
MGLVFLRIARRVPPAPAKNPTHADWRGLWHAWSRPRGLALVALISLYNMALFALMSMSPLYLMQEKALSPVETGLAFSAMMLVGALSQPFTGRLSDRRGRRPVILGGCAIAAVASLALWQAEALWLILALMALSMGVLIAVRSAILAAAVELVESRESTVLGLAFALMDGIGALGAVLAGLVAVGAMENAFLLAALFALGSLGLTVSLPPKAPAEARLGVAGGE